MAGSEVEVVQDWTPFLLGDEAPEFVDPEQASRDIVMQILAAPDEAGVFDIAGTTAVEDILDRPIQINGAKAMRSAYDAGATMYLLLDAADLETGEQLKVTCGARNVMAQLYRLVQLHALPVRGRICRTDRPTAAGYYPLWLRRLEPSS